MASEAFDAIVVGAGFSGLLILYELRKHGFRVKLIEEGSGLGGIWRWNCYPGARVDSEYFVYQFHHSELGTDFPWSQRFPDFKELRAYFAHVDNQVNLSKDIQFHTRLTGATFDENGSQWKLICKNSGATTTISCRHLILATGFASKRYVPPFKGLETFQGECHHTSYWPQDREVEIRGKRVAVIGTGCSGVQVIQTIGPEVAHLTVYQRTPNLAIPMQQVNRDSSQTQWNFPNPSEYPAIFEKCSKSFEGMGFEISLNPCMEQTPEEREKFYEIVYRGGGLRFAGATYFDVLLDKNANATAYDFWQRRSSARIRDPKKRELLAPKVAPHYFGTKRASLEQTYYEVFNQHNVDIVDLQEDPILEITQNGIRTEKGGVVDVDLIVLATGFDNVTGGLLDMDIVNGSGDTLRSTWAGGVSTQFGLMAHGFPNMFFMYGPQAPTALSNGPTTIKIQADWIKELLLTMRSGGKTRVEPTKEAVEEWKAIVNQTWNLFLFPLTPSILQGDNIPGKRREPLNYAGGIPDYSSRLEKSRDKNYEGFIIS